MDASKDFYLKIITPESILFDGKSTMVTLPGVQGEFSVLPGHISFMSVLKEGIIKIYKNSSENFEEIKISEAAIAQVDANASEVIILL